MIKLLFAAVLCLFATNAFAASTCAVKEYAVLTATSSGGSAAQAAAEPSLVDQGDIDFTSGHAESAAFGASTKFIRVKCYAQAAFAVGLAPVAAIGMSWIATGETEYFGVQSGHKISFVTKP
jgi:spore coat protein U-like protein